MSARHETEFWAVTDNIGSPVYFARDRRHFRTHYSDDGWPHTVSDLFADGHILEDVFLWRIPRDGKPRKYRVSLSEVVDDDERT